MRFQSTARAGAEAAAKTIENPTPQKIDAALAQVDALCSNSGAVQNRFNSDITNPSNTVNNLSSAQSYRRFRLTLTEVSNMSRAQILRRYFRSQRRLPTVSHRNRAVLLR